MTYLLDVNVLIALIDPHHVAHDDAHAWFDKTGAESWATCPLTENGLIRIVGSPRYPYSPGSPAAIAERLTVLRRLPGHTFWSDDLSIVDTESVDPARILVSAQVTDTYLLALARSKGGFLATFDRKMTTVAVTEGKSALHVIPSR